MKIGYARVSRQDQNLERQIDALMKDQCEEIYSDKIGGGERSRPELDKMLARLRSGDIVVVQKLDRLGRSLSHLLSLVEMFKEMGIEFKSLGDNFDTSTPGGRLVFQMMGAIAEFEKGMIRERTKDSLQNAKRRGKILGPPRKDYTEDVKKFISCLGSKEEVMKQMGISEFKYYRLKKLSK